MNIDDILADLENNSNSSFSRTNLNNVTNANTSKSMSDIMNNSFRTGSRIDGTTNVVSEANTSLMSENNDISHVSNIYSSLPTIKTERLTKTEKNQVDIQAYIELTTAWRNERLSPELLPYKEEVFNLVTDNLKRQVEYIDYWNMMQESENLNEITDDRRNNEQLLIKKKLNKIPILCMEAELERVKFLMRSYLRCRLQKIDKFLMLLEENDFQVWDEENLIEKSGLVVNKLLSEAEYRYMKSKFKILSKLYNSTILLHLPDSFQQINDPNSNVKMVTEPDMQEFVFIFVKGNNDPQSENVVYSVFIKETQEEVELVVGGIYVMRYDLVEQYIKQNIVMLI
ncbi:DNA replication protein [Hanseniaspora uvarum]|nr:DNA replication protein [Hanseniaspora uvarum]